MLELAAIQTEISDVSRVLLRPLMGDLVSFLWVRLVDLLRSPTPRTPLDPETARQVKGELQVLEDTLVSVMSEEALQLSRAAQDCLDLTSGVGPVRVDKGPARQFACFQYT